MMPAACRQETSGEHTLIKQRKRDDYCLRLNLKYRFNEAESFGMLTMNATSNRNQFIPMARRNRRFFTILLYYVSVKNATF